MRVSCEAPRETCSESLVEDITILLGKEPIVTPTVVRAVYEGNDVSLGEAIIERFQKEVDYGVVADYEKKELSKKKGR